MPINDDMEFSPSPDGNASPTDLVAAIVFDLLIRLKVAEPAKVVKWRAPKQGNVDDALGPRVDVKLSFKYARAIDNEGDLKQGEQLSRETAGLRAVGEWPTLPNLPVVTWGSPRFGHRGKIPEGTTGVVLFMDKLMDQWKNTGGPIDPGVHEPHSLNNGVFIPTLYHGRNSPPIDENVDVIGPEDGSAGLELNADSKDLRLFTSGSTATVDAATAVDLGAGATLGVARLNDDVSAKAAMTTWALVVETFINTIAPGTITPANSFATTVAAANGFGSISSASAKVKAE